MWPRIAAYIFDLALATLLTGAIVQLLAPEPRRTSGIHLLTFVAAWALVRVAGAAIAGESPGKRMVRIATVDAAGRPIGHAVRALRELPVWLLYWIPLVAPIDAAVAERRGHRGLRDRMTGTTVVTRGSVTRGRVAGVLLLALLVLGAAAASLGSWNTSPERVRAGFLSGCVRSGGSAAACECAWDHVRGRLSNDEIVLADQAIGLGGSADPRSEQILNESAQACRYVHAGVSGRAGAPVQADPQVKPKPPSAASGLSEAVRRRSRAKVIAVCTRTGRARSHCACVYDRASREIDPRRLAESSTAIERKQLIDPVAGDVLRRAVADCARRIAVPTAVAAH
jgi:uncharacterized RDD family membrane protein YckC